MDFHGALEDPETEDIGQRSDLYAEFCVSFDVYTTLQSDNHA